MVGLIVAILVSAAVINGGNNGTEEFIAHQAWLYVSILGAGYFISRGLARSGSREPASARTTARRLVLSFRRRLASVSGRRVPNTSASRSDSHSLDLAGSGGLAR